MTWSTPATFTAAAVLTAAQLNTNLRDDMAFLYGGASGTAPGFATRQNAVTACANGTETTIIFQVADQNIDTMYATGTGIATIPASRTGLWLFTATLEWASNVTGTRGLQIETSTASKSAWNWLSAATDGTGRQNAAVLYYMTAADTVFVQGRQSSGGSLNTAGTVTCTFSGRFLGG